MKYVFQAVLGFAIGAALAFLLTGCSKSTRSLYVGTAASTMRMLNPDNLDSGGTGFLLTLPSGNTVIMTNAHVCNMTKQPYVISDYQGGQRRSAILEIASDTDLCMVEAPKGVRGLRLAKTASIYDEVAVVGHPYLLPVTFSPGFINYRSNILVSYCEVFKYEPQMIPPGGHPQDGLMDLFMPDCVKSVDAYYMSNRTAPGNSGSPVVNLDGDVVGVLFAGGASGFNSAAIPLSRIKGFVAGH